MAQKPNSPKELREAVKAIVDAGGVKAKAASNLGIKTTTLKDRYHSALRFFDRFTEADQTPLAERQRQAFQDRINELTAKLRHAHREETTAERVRSQLFGLAEQSPEPPNWVLKASKKSTGVTGIPVTIWSDWHYGEVVDPDQVEGINEFNVKIFEARFKRLVENTIDLCTQHMTSTDYPGIVVNLGGDMISGNIHEELTETNELQSMPSVMNLAGHIIWGLNALADQFGRVFVPCVAGNHGRNTRRPQAKNMVYTSFDWLLYNIVESHFKSMEDSRVQFYIPNGFDAYYRVYGQRLLLTHGDRIGAKGGDGFIGSIGPILRGTRKMTLAYGRNGRAIDCVLMGHYHQTVTMRDVIVNGSIKGYDEWAMSMRFDPEPPTQSLFFIHPKRGRTCWWPVQLEDPVSIDTAADWVSFPKTD